MDPVHTCTSSSLMTDSARLKSTWHKLDGPCRPTLPHSLCPMLIKAVTVNEYVAAQFCTVPDFLRKLLCSSD